MSTTLHTSPNEFSAGYSALPVSFSDTRFNMYDSFKYVNNIIWNNSTGTQTSIYNIGTIGYTKIKTSNPNVYKLGETILVDDTANDNRINGYYNIIKIISTTEFVIDLMFDTPNTNSFAIHSVIRYNMPPDFNGRARLDISNTIKNFLTDNLEDNNTIFNGPNTVFRYGLKQGVEYQYTFKYDEADTSGAYYKMISNSLTNPNQIEYSVGDEIVIEQDVTKWDYYDNQFVAGHQLGFIGNTPPPFIIGKGVEVTGQEHIPSYNGPAQVVNKLGNILQVNKTFAANTPADDGSIYGLVTDVYNTVGKITDIQYIPGTGLVITTDIPVTDITTAGGTSKFADGRITMIPNTAYSGVKRAYNARLSNDEYSIDGYKDYVTASALPSVNMISTIYNSSEVYDIERSAKSFLLFHMVNTFANEITPTFSFYNSSNVLICEMSLRNTSMLTDYYFPIGLNQLVAMSSDSNLITAHSGTLSTIVDDVTSYTVRMTKNNPAEPWTKEIKFNVKDDCKSYELLHLMWKDALGSWITLPFNMKSFDNLEVSRKTYYKKEGNWDNNTFGYNNLDRGEKNYFSRSRESKRVNSGWMKQEEVRLVSDLFKSASVYIQDDKGKLIPAHIDEHEIELIKNENGDLIQYEFNLRFSTNDYRW